MRLKREDIRVRPWFLASAAWSGPAILAIVKVFIEFRLGDRKEVTWQTLFWESGDWLIYAVFTPPVFWLANRYPLRRGTLWKTLPFHFLASIVFCAGWTTAGSFLHSWLFPSEKTDWSKMGWFVGSLPFGFAVYFAVVAAEHAFRYLIESRQRETQAALLAAQLAEARLGALRMQLNPHFLFNSLNTILVMVRDGDDKAAASSIERLADVLRRVLKIDQKHEITLAEEIDFLGQYLAIEQSRFSDRLHPHFDIAHALRAASVPELILQPLVENALRHGFGKRTESGKLLISARREGGDLLLIVQDDGAGLPTEAIQEGVGLANTRERLATLYGNRGQLELSRRDGGGAIAVIRLPFHEHPSGTSDS